ncbi:MAG: GNAT family N-acetyltransferase [Bacteroidales bacterium]
MNIQRVSNKQIDKTAWDNCIRHTENRRVYALSWYLDSLTNNKWEALILDDFKAVMPLPFIRKVGFKMYIQPLFCQQLGPFWTFGYPPGLMTNFKSKIPSPFYALNLSGPARFYPENASLRVKLNMVLPLDKTYKNIYSQFTTNHKRNIKKAEKSGLEVREVSIDEFLELKKNNSELKHPGTLNRLSKLLQEIQNKGLLIPHGTWRNNKLISAVCWVKDFDRLIYFQAASNDEGRKYAAAFLLVNRILQQYQNSKWTIDFEGSSIPGVRRFYRGFGAMNEAYPVLISKNMQFVYKIMSR